MRFIKKKHKKFNKGYYKKYVLGADIGGTNSNFGLFGCTNGKPILLESFHFKTKDVKNFDSLVSDVLKDIQNNYEIKLEKACIAAAGIISSDNSFVSLSNAKWAISIKSLTKNTNLQRVFLMNDFSGVGYGLNMLKKRDIITIKKGNRVPKAPMVIIGAGTGLGKSNLIYNEAKKMHIPIASEGGHAEFAAQNELESDLAAYLRSKKRISLVTYENILSGNGIKNVYEFLKGYKKFKKSKYSDLIDNSKDKPPLISKYKKFDKTSKAVFEVFRDVYARFAMHCALDMLPYNGIYIAGGIAEKNKEIFNSKFVNQFNKAHKSIKKAVKNTPIYLISNYNAGLYGAGFYAAKFL